MNEKKMRAKTIKDYNFWSTGVYLGCPICQRNIAFDFNIDVDDDVEKEIERLVKAGEIDSPYYGFSWRECEICGSLLGGSRYLFHARDDEGDLYHFIGCIECFEEINGIE